MKETMQQHLHTVGQKAIVRYNMTIEVRYIALKGKHLWMRT